jgi:hypothetical protein
MSAYHRKENKSLITWRSFSICSFCASVYSKIGLTTVPEDGFVINLCVIDMVNSGGSGGRLQVLWTRLRDGKTGWC